MVTDSHPCQHQPSCDLPTPTLMPAHFNVDAVMGWWPMPPSQTTTQWWVLVWVNPHYISILSTYIVYKYIYLIFTLVSHDKYLEGSWGGNGYPDHQVRDFKSKVMRNVGNRQGDSEDSTDCLNAIKGKLLTEESAYASTLQLKCTDSPALFRPSTHPKNHSYGIISE